MQAFTQLYNALDETNKTTGKLAALKHYFRQAPAADGAWVLYFLVGRRPRRAINGRRLSEWAAEEAGIPLWLFGESYDAVGDMAETITLLLPETEVESQDSLHTWVEERLLPLQTLPEAEQKIAVHQAWRELSQPQRFIWNKLITGGFRVGVSQQLVARALAEVSNSEPSSIAHRLMGQWEPTPDFYHNLLHLATSDADLSRPYPFCLAFALEDAVARNPTTQLGDLHDWQVEWKWDGIRAQLIRRQGEIFLWSRGEELVSDRYPEVIKAAALLPDDIVLDGELLPWSGDLALPFTQLQLRIGRKTVSKKLLAEVPVVFLAYDLLEFNGSDWRNQPLSKRRLQLAAVLSQINSSTFRLSPIVQANSWEDLAMLRQESRQRRVEGFMLKRRSSSYGVGRQRGDWWKWKIDPYTVDAVLITAQRGSGKRASLYSDYTFAVWDDTGKLVPFAKAYSGLTDAEIRQVDRFVRDNTLEKFGPVRSVKPELVFELAFEAIQRSNRHKSGIAVRFPRILRWRQDKKIEDADSLATIQTMLEDG